MSKLAALSLKNKALIALVTIVAALFGGLALTNLKQELIPEIQLPQLMIVTAYPGASPDVVDADVSQPIEAAIRGVSGLESTSTTSSTNVSMVSASFDYGTDLAAAEQKLSVAISRIKSQLPADLDPQVRALSTSDIPVVVLAVTGYSDAAQAEERLRNVVVPLVQDVDGVNEASLIGAEAQRIMVTPDTAKLAANGLSAASVADVLKQYGLLFPGGAITENDQTLTVQTGSKITSVDALAQVPLVVAGRAPVKLSDVATVELEPEPVTSISRVNGEPALSIMVSKLPSANTVDVSKGVNALIPEIETQLGGATVTTVFDQSPFIEESIAALAQEGLLGLLFAVLVILVFLFSVRATLVTAISIPTSVLMTFIGIQAFGYSLNILTLGALTIAIGRVVDDSIVVIENIRRHYVEGADKTQAILLAVREVAGAITASTITTVAVFLPIAFVGDMTGELFRPFALTVTLAMLSSLLVSLTIVPVLAYWFLKPAAAVTLADGTVVDPESPEAPPTKLQSAYLPVLNWTLKHSWATLGAAVLVLAGTLALAPLMKTNFLGDTGQNTFVVSQSLGTTASLESQDAAAAIVEEAIMGVDGIEIVQVSIGSGANPMSAFMGGGGNTVSFQITTDSNADQDAVQAATQAALDTLTGVGDVSVTSQAGLASSQLEVNVTAPDRATLLQASEQVVSALKNADDLKQVSSNLSATVPYIAVDVDREAAAQMGLSEVAVGGLVFQAMQPYSIGTVELDGTGVSVYLASANPPQTVAELNALQVGPAKLSDIATIEEREGPASITSSRGQRTATIMAEPATDNLTAATSSLETALDELDLPEGASASIGGVASDQEAAFSQLGLAMLVAILIVYVVMVATFKSLRQPLLLLISVPFAATGAILLQLITGVPLGVASLIGVLMLIGIVVTNAIVLIDLVNQYREHGLSAHEATLAGSARRLRPILMTAAATIFALLPMALGITGHGGFISQPLAIIVIGGLLSSTVLTLLVLPTLYNLVEGARERRGGVDAHGAEADASAAAEQLITGPMRKSAGFASADVAASAEPGGAVATAVAESTQPADTADAASVDDLPDVNQLSRRARRAQNQTPETPDTAE